jgi:urease accessory protein
VSDAALLAALQLGDSLFPSGGFTLSHGLETLAERGLIRDRADLAAWIGSSLVRQVGPSDGVAAAAAWDSAGDPATLAAIDATLFATKLAREPREVSVRTGRQLLGVLARIVGEPLSAFQAEVRAGRSPGTQPVVLGLGGRATGLDRRATVLLLLHQYVAGCLGAALRLLDVDDVEAQQARYALTPTIAAAADAALALPWEEMYACAPQTELMTMLHERSTVRLFAT